MYLRLIRAHTQPSLILQQAYVQTHRIQKPRYETRRLQTCGALAERPVESHEPHKSNVVADNRGSDNALLNTVDDPQGYIAHEAEILEPSASSGHAQASSYTKAERANLANIPESQMTPEMLRRWRISKANKGKQPWNKGRQHRPGSRADAAFLCVTCVMWHSACCRDHRQDSRTHKSCYAASGSACQGQSKSSIDKAYLSDKGG